VLHPLVALAYVDRVMESRVLDVFVIVPLIRRDFVLMLLFAGGMAVLPLDRARHSDALLFARRVREVGGGTMPCGWG
jgi:hypothetical protein